MSKKDLTKKTIDAVAKNNSDTGSTEVQISILTEKINNLAEHLKTNRKDKHSTRGLLQMVANRRKLIKYLNKKDSESWNALADKLGLKK